MNQKIKKTKSRSKTYKNTTKKYKYPKNLEINFNKDKQKRELNKSYIPKIYLEKRCEYKKKKKKFNYK